MVLETQTFLLKRHSFAAHRLKNFFQLNDVCGNMGEFRDGRRYETKLSGATDA